MRIILILIVLLYAIILLSKVGTRPLIFKLRLKRLPLITLLIYHDIALLYYYCPIYEGSLLYWPQYGCPLIVSIYHDNMTILGILLSTLLAGDHKALSSATEEFNHLHRWPVNFPQEKSRNQTSPRSPSNFK